MLLIMRCTSERICFHGSMPPGSWDMKGRHSTTNPDNASYFTLCKAFVEWDIQALYTITCAFLPLHLLLNFKKIIPVTCHMMQ